MTTTKLNRKIVIVNQAVNYLTIGFANAFNEKFEKVSLITGSVHAQGEELCKEIEIQYINKLIDSPGWKKFVSYFIACLHIWWLLLTKYRKYEVFFVSIPPMAYLLNLFVPNRFSMVIWDVYPDSFKIIGMSEQSSVYRLWSWLNKLSFKKAWRLFTISDSMADLIAQYVANDKIIIQPIWSIFQCNLKVERNVNPFILEHQLYNKFVVQYSGNIGLTHKVEAVLVLAEHLKNNNNIHFQIIGRGPRKALLQKLVLEKNLHNCSFLPFQSDEMFPYSLGAANLGVVILDEKTSKGSVPSKSYNLMSFGIPSLYICPKDSQLQKYADKYGHARSFSEKRLSEAAEFIERLSKDPDLHMEMSKRSETASLDFRRKNADYFAEKYINP